MYKIIESFNENTKLALRDKTVFVLKRISLEDVPVMKKLMGVNNPHIVKFYDFCEIDGIFYVVEEYIQGVTLEEYTKANFPLDDKTVNNIASSICVALICIHGLGIIHRDINPNNIMIDNSGIVKLIDFGISRSVVPDKRLDTHILGTQGYAAPEQYGFSQTNEKADIYSLGVVINYMLTMKLPNEQRATGYFAPIIAKCTEIDENKRYSNADELLKDLKHKRRRHNIFKAIPGFRPNTPMYKTVGAVIYYLFCIFFEVLTVSGDGSMRMALYDGFSIFFIFIMPFFLAVDAFDYLEWLPVSRYKSKREKRGYKIIFIFVSFFIASALILLSERK